MAVIMYKNKAYGGGLSPEQAEKLEKLNQAHGSADISEIGDGTVTGGMVALNTGLKETDEAVEKRALSINLSYSNSSTQTNAPWKVIKEAYEKGILPSGVHVSGTISCGSFYGYEGYYSGSYGSWLIHVYYSQIFHVILSGGSWKYEMVSVGSATSF